MASLIAVTVATASESVGPARFAAAHTPHDPASHIELSATFAADGTGFAVVDGRILRTTDAFASTTMINNGLTGGDVVSVAMAPSDAQVVYAAGLAGDIYRSTNSGQAFERLVVDANERFGLVEVAADNPSVVLAVGVAGVMYRSVDGGTSWSPVTDLGTVSAIESARGGASRFVAGNGAGQVFVSSDNGVSWDASSPPFSSAVTAIGFSEIDQLDVVVSTATGEVHRSVDGGTTFTSRAAVGIAGTNVRGISLAENPGGPRIIWATTDAGAYRSTDDGASFVPVLDGLSADREANGQLAFAFRTIAATSDAAGRPFVAVAGFDGVFLLDSDTERWASVETFADAITGIAVSPTFGTDRTIAVTTYSKGAYTSTDGGDTYRLTSRGLTQDSVGRSNTVLPVQRLQAVEFSPDFADSEDLFTATTDKFAVSTDAGRNWKEVLVAPPVTEGPKVRHFAIGVGTTVIGPTIILGSSQGVIYRSDRGGAQGTWKATTDTGSRVRNIVLSPTFSTIPELFVSTQGGVLYSDNGATTFVTVNTSARDAVLAISPDYQSDRTIFAGATSGLEVSRDGGQTWNTLSVTAGPTEISALAVSPNFAIDGTLLVSVSGIGLFRSTDRGATFTPVARELSADNLIVSDFGPFPTAKPLQFADDGTLVAFSGSAVLTSVDMGDTWTVREPPSYLDFVAPPPPNEPSPEATESSEPPVTEAPGALSPPATAIPLEETGERNQRIWIVTLLVCAIALGVMLITARARRGPLRAFRESLLRGRQASPK